MSGALCTKTDRNRSSHQRTRVLGSLLVSAVVTALTLGVAFALLGLGVDFFWIVYPVGFGVVLPTALSIMNYHWSQRDDQDSHSNGRASGDRLEELRMRYVRGEISEVELERELDSLLETTGTQ